MVDTKSQLLINKEECKAEKASFHEHANDIKKNSIKSATKLIEAVHVLRWKKAQNRKEERKKTRYR